MKKVRIISNILLVLVACTTAANNIQVSNLVLTDQNTADGYTMVQFDLHWENSWRYDTGPANWDAAWVFVKWREVKERGEGEQRLEGPVRHPGDGVYAMGDWHHAHLHESGHDSKGAHLDVGLLFPGENYNHEINPVMGVFIHRTEDELGAGVYGRDGIQLRWNYRKYNLEDDAILDIMVFAIEMVYIPAGRFFLGSGGVESNRFHAGGQSNITPFDMTEEWNRQLGNNNGQLWATGQIAGATLNSDYPTGVEPFYIMKYELSQQQYVDFLNTLMPHQATTREYLNGGQRHSIEKSEDWDEYSTSLPNVPCNWISWPDAAAYADWAGLRPFTELEYEKVCRRPLNPQRNAYVWDNTTIARAEGIENEGQIHEIATPPDANAVYGGTLGPLRVGNFARHQTTRTQSGGTYFGVMDFSGNLWAQVVNLSHADGRAFTARHGDGVLTNNGNANVTGWPGLINGEITGANGMGLRGGAFDSDRDRLRISDRNNISTVPSTRQNNNGFRAARTAP